MNIKEFLEKHKQNVGLNADWGVSAYHVLHVNEFTNLFFFDGENGFFNLTLVTYDTEDDQMSVELLEVEDRESIEQVSALADKLNCSGQVAGAVREYLQVPKRYFVKYFDPNTFTLLYLAQDNLNYPTTKYEKRAEFSSREEAEEAIHNYIFPEFACKIEEVIV